MKIKRTSQIITVFVIVMSLIAIACAVFARYYWLISQQAYEARRKMFGYTTQLAMGSDRLTNSARAYASTGDRTYYNAFQQELWTDRNRDVAIAGLEKLGLTQPEQDLINRAKQSSDKLVILENQAFTAVEQGD